MIALEDPNQPTWRSEYIQLPVEDRKRVATSQPHQTALAIDRELGGNVDIRRHLQWISPNTTIGTFVNETKQDRHRNIELLGDHRIWHWMLLKPDGTTQDLWPRMYDIKFRELHNFRHDDGFVWLLFRPVIQ